MHIDKETHVATPGTLSSPSPADPSDGSATELSIIIPAYNEARRIATTLDRIHAYLAERHLDGEVIVVDDGSQDDTPAIVRARAAGWDGLRLVSLKSNAGKGEAVRRGMAAARGRIRIFSDADLSVPIDELDKLLEPLHKGAAVAIASRGLRRSRLEVRQPWHRQTMGRIFNRLVRLTVLEGISDTQCGFKAFTAEAAATLFPPLGTRRFGFDVEVLYRARRSGFTIAEVPTRWINSPQSKVSPFSDSIVMLFELMAIRRLVKRRPGRSRPEV